MTDWELIGILAAMCIISFATGFILYAMLCVTSKKESESINKKLLEACEHVVKWHREHDSGEGELFGLDFVTTCINAIRKAKELNQ